MLWLLITSITVSLKRMSNMKMKNTLISKLDPLLFQLDMLRQMDTGWYYQNHFHSEFQASPQAEMREREKINQLPTVIYTRKFTLNKFIHAPLLEEWPLEEENKCSLVSTLPLSPSFSLYWVCIPFPRIPMSGIVWIINERHRGKGNILWLIVCYIRPSNLSLPLFLSLHPLTKILSLHGFCGRFS